MAALEPVIATLIANTAEFTAGLDEAKAAMADFAATAGVEGDAAGAGLATGAKDGAASLEADLGAAGLAGGAALHDGVEDGTRDVADDLAKDGEDAGSKFSNAMSGGLGKLANLISNTGLPLGPLSEGLEKSSDATKDLDSSSGSLFNSMAGIGKVAFLGLAVAGAAAAAEGIHLAMSMQTADAAIAVAAGSTIQSAKNIGNAFLATAGSSEFSGEEMATAFAGVAGQLKSAQGATLDTAQALQVMSAAGNLATAKQISLATATGTVASAMQAFQLKTKDASSVSDLLLNASNATGQSVSALGNALDKTKTKLGGMSPPIQQLSGLLVDMTNHGETGRAAMTALTSTFTNFLKPASAVATAQNNLNVAIKQLPPSLQALGQQVASGTITSTAYTAATANLSTTQATLIGNVQSAQKAMVTANDAQAKMGITATNAQGQLLPLSNIIGQLQDKIKGMTTGEAIATLTSMGFSSASSKLVETIQAGPGAFDAATDSTNKAGSAQAAAAIQARTLGVEFKTLKATAEDVLTEFGQFLIPIVQTLGQVFVSATKFVLDHKDVLYTLGILVGGFLTATIGAFAINTMASLVGSIVRAGTTVTTFTSNLLGMGTSSTEAAAETETLTTSSTELSGVVEGLTAATEQLVAATAQLTPATANADTGMEAEAVAATEAAAAMRALTASEEGAVGGMAAAGTAAEGLAVKEEALAATSTEAGAAAGEAGLAGGMTEGGIAAGGLTAALIPLAAILTPVAMSVYAATHANDGFKVSLQGSAAQAMDMTANTLPQMAVKIDDLRQSQEQATQKIREGGLAGQVAQSAYNTLGAEIDTLRNQQTNLSNNLTILSGNFGISKSQAESLAQATGIDLTKALDPAKVNAFAEEIQLSGANMDTAGAKAQNMGSTTVAAISSMAAQMKTTLNSQNWSSIGSNIDSGLAGGIAGGSSLVTAAISSLAGKTLLAGQAAVGAKSPSTKARDLIGMPIAQGVALGIAQGAGLPSAATTAMMNGVLNAGTGSLGVGIAGGAATAAGSGGGTGGGTTVLNVTTPVQIAGQTLAQIVTQYQLRGARATGNVLGQFSGGTQSQTATSINTNAVAR